MKHLRFKIDFNKIVLGSKASKTKIKVLKEILENKCLIVIILLSIITYATWFSLNTFANGDWFFGYKESLVDYLRLSIWQPQVGLGSVSQTLFRVPINIFFGLFAKLFSVNSSTIDIFVSYIPICLGLPIVSYNFIYRLFKNKIAAFFGALVISFNTYFLTIDTEGHGLITVAFVFCLLAFTFLIEAIKYNNVKKWIISAIFFSVGGYFDFRVLYIFAFLCFVVLAKLIISNFKYKDYYKLLLFISLILLLNCFWLLPTVVSGFGENILNRPLFGEQFWSIWYAVALYHPFWTGGQPVWFSTQIIPVYVWILPLLALLGFVVGRKNYWVQTFALIGVIGIFLTKQSDEPFGYVYKYLYENLPGFSAFREASKFYILILISYSVLVSYFIVWAFKNLNKYIFKFITASLLLVFLYNITPMLTGEIGTMFTPRQIDSSYIEFKDKIINENDFYRVLWLPVSNRWSFSSYNKPKVDAVSLFDIDIFKDQIGHVRDDNYMDVIFKTLKITSTDSMFDLMSIKYIVIPRVDYENNENIFVEYGLEGDLRIRQHYVELLDSVPWLRKVHMKPGGLIVYENSNYNNQVFVFDNLVNLNSFNNIDTKLKDIKTLKLNTYFTNDSSENNNLVDIDYPFEDINSENIIDNSINNIINLSSGKTIELYHQSDLDDISLNNFKLKNILDNRKINKFIDGDNLITLKEKGYSFNNIFTNGSFNYGLWNAMVDDCYNYDNQPKIDMKLGYEDNAHGNILELKTVNHRACTNKIIEIEGGVEYSFSFDHKVINSDHAVYYIEFNDSLNTVVTDVVPSNSVWQKYSKRFVSPIGATSMRIYVYADSIDNKTIATNIYDNFELIKIPDIYKSTFIVQYPKGNKLEPKSILFDEINPSKLRIHIEKATTSFYLGFSQKYHNDWGLYAIVKDKTIQINNKYHYELNGITNSWYIDVNSLCKENNMCKINNDGSYNIEMAIEFKSQKYLVLGLLISGLTLICSVVFLIFSRIR